MDLIMRGTNCLRFSQWIVAALLEVPPKRSANRGWSFPAGVARLAGGTTEAAAVKEGTFFLGLCVKYLTLLSHLSTHRKDDSSCGTADTTYTCSDLVRW